MKHRLNSMFTTLTLSLLAPTVALAQSATPTGTGLNRPAGGLDDPSKFNDFIGPLISWLIQLAIYGAAIACFFYLCYGAFLWGTATSPESAKTGRQTIKYAAFGFVIVTMVYIFIIIFNNLLP